jgi:TATA-binding protein-associated factor
LTASSIDIGLSPRLDRLLVLLDTGSSSNVRQTAAKQLAELAAKSVIGDVKIEEDVKNLRSDIPRADVAAWAELMGVIGRVCMRPFSYSYS